MARSRNLKPGFFVNEQLAECEPLARLLFQGLWCHADREGRLEDRPKRIRAEILPYDTKTDIEALLKQLEERGFLLRYEAENNKYIQVVNFSKHQNPHVKEPASTIPAPDKYQTSTMQAPVRPGLLPLTESLLPLTESLQEANPLPNGNGRAPSPPLRPIDLKADLWKTGVAFLKTYGVEETRSRPLIGRWRRDHGDAAVIDAIAQAETCAASEPVAFIEGCLRKANGKKLTPMESLYRGAALAIEKIEREQDDRSKLTDGRGASNAPPEPLLDSGGRPALARPPDG